MEFKDQLSEVESETSVEEPVEEDSGSKSDLPDYIEDDYDEERVGVGNYSQED